MGVRASLLAIVPLNSEVSTCASDGQDLVGMLNFAAEKVADAIQVLNAINNVLPSGSNKTTIASQITSLS